MEDKQKNLISELRKGRELAKQLQVHLNVPSSPRESRELLVHKILNSYDKALSMLNTSRGNYESQNVDAEAVNVGGSPHSFSGSEDSKDPDQKHGSRKRKSSMHRWTHQVQTSPATATGFEGPLDDGYSWRKYGQKDILGAKFPRGYYRCTHRNVQGCLATKQVQRSDDDPTIFEITYRGKHTCTHGNGPHPSLPPPPSPDKQEPTHEPAPPQSHPQSPDALLNFQTGLKFITQNMDFPDHLKSFPSFHFGSTSNHDAGGNYSVQSSVMLNSNNFPAVNYSPALVSPATSESNFVSVSPKSNFQASDCELSEVVSAAATSGNKSTNAVGLELPFGQMEFDHNFTFDNPSFFS